MQTRFSGIFILSTLLALTVQVANARTWRVNKLSNYASGGVTNGENYGGTQANPVFKELTDVIASNLVSPTNGDTVHLEGAVSVYDNVTLTKRLVIIGPGFFLDENLNVTNNVLEAKIAVITFAAGSEFSQLIGIHFVTNSLPIRIGNISNILVKRCQIDHSISIGLNNSNIFIIQNYFTNITNSPTESAIEPTNTLGFASNFIFNNNICRSLFILKANSSVYTAQQCNNNVFDCPTVSGGPSLAFNAAECRNNIIRSPNILVEVNGSNTNFTNNTSNITSQLLGTDPTNVHSAANSDLFVSTGTSDGRYQLNASSPDNVPGSDGTERGVFGGLANSNKYTLSGLAPIPVIYEITTSGVANPPLGLPVIIKARIIN